MRRVHRYGSEQRIELAGAVVVHERQPRLIQLVDAEDTNALLGQFRPQTLVPAGILFFDKIASRVFDELPLLQHSEPVGSSGVVAVFELLQQAAYPDLEELVQIAGRDGEKLHSFEQRVAQIPGFFQYAQIEFQPRCFAVQEWGAIAQSLPNHVYPTMFIEPCLSNHVDRTSLFVERWASAAGRDTRPSRV